MGTTSSEFKLYAQATSIAADARRVSATSVLHDLYRLFSWVDGAILDCLPTRTTGWRLVLCISDRNLIWLPLSSSLNYAMRDELNRSDRCLLLGGDHDLVVRKEE